MATGAPGTNGVWQYGEDDSEATFSALLNKVASTADTQIGTDRGRLTTLEARRLAAFSPVIPTGVTASTGSASYNSTTGIITFTNARDINIAGFLNSTYANYKMIIDYVGTAPGSEIGAWFTNAGTNIASGWYGASFYTSYSGTAALVQPRSSGNGGWIGYNNTEGAFTELTIYPHTALSKLHYTLLGYSKPVAAGTFGGYGVDGTADGFKISPLTAGVTLTGTIRVMGCK